ncbi:hypothetical protein RND71_027575 [Anisodus tanguticus]|uniref:Uncharacterized protein n=1 Tax=Anisodus tanguticus TaxID=243964 RepID=A0AAE1V1V3_9SOLA|nr:hypothetical protein RND71_027575 [Anisodus tanguticus]
MTHSMFKADGLERFKCFISLETLDKNEPAMTTARSWGNTSFSSYGEVSQACSKFYESEDLVDSSTSNVANHPYPEFDTDCGPTLLLRVGEAELVADHVVITGFICQKSVQGVQPEPTCNECDKDDALRTDISN